MAFSLMAFIYEANGKDRRVHYAADDDFEDLSLDDLRTIALSDEKACDECRSRMIFCDGTQTFCLNNESIDEEEVEQDVEEEAELNEVVKESRGSRRQSGRGEQKVEKSDDEESPEFFQPTDNDMILSLKDPKYKEIMHKAFRKLGAKAESNRDKDEERQVKMDVFDSLKESGFQLTKHVNYRKPDLGVMAVDDAYARDSKFFGRQFLVYSFLFQPSHIVLLFIILVNQKLILISVGGLNPKSAGPTKVMTATVMR